MGKQLSTDLKKRAGELHAETVATRRRIHRRPELEFDLFETAGIVGSRLKELGIPFVDGVAKTGIVATIDGDLPGPTIALRADMDALPIEEQSGVEYASEIAGRMHACGHDAHTACLLTTAQLLNERRGAISGAVRLIFQPCEEKLPGGASAMIDEGALAEADGTLGVREIFGQHVSPDLPVGTIGIRSGAYMASADEIYVTVRGEGGHAAGPHRLATDVTLVASHVVVALQSVVSRNAHPAAPTVLSIGRLVADGATNVIPATARIEGTLRAMDEAWRFRAHDLIRRVVEQTAAAYGATAEIDIVVGYPLLVNDAVAAAFVRQSAIDFVGADKVVDLEAWFGAEDFAYYLQDIPGAFYRFGTGNPEKNTEYGLHNPRFNIDEDALAVAPAFMAYLALRRAAS